MKKALITGVGGQDGSYLSELLLKKGYKVHGVVRRASYPNTDRSRHQDISYELPWNPAGQDRKEIGRAPTDNIQPFTKNASNGKSGK